MHLFLDNKMPTLEITEGEAKELRIRPEIRTADVRLVIKRGEADELNDVLAGKKSNTTTDSTLQEIGNITEDLWKAIRKNPILVAFVCLLVGFLLAKLF